VDPEIEQLLILQDRDTRLINIELSLKSIPTEIAKNEQKIAAEESALAADHQRLQELEVRRKDLDNDVKTAEEQVVKYKNQQLQVKKNDEYQALTHEIDQTQERIGQLEETELELMLEIDEAKAAFETEKKEREERIQLYRDEIETLQDREQTLKGEIDSAKADKAAAEKECAQNYLDAYNRTKRRRPKPPFVSPIEDHKCGGCHLKVSGEVESSTRRKDGPVQCDSCGRVVYWED